MEDLQQRQADTVVCDSCGGIMTYMPGTTQLHCSYCGANKDIEQLPTNVLEFDFEAYSKQQESFGGVSKVLDCRNCGASIILDENSKASICPYCSTPMIEADIHDERLIKPSYILPFNIHSDDVGKKLIDWIDKRWFAPSDLKKLTKRADIVHGYYIPIWTYDAQTETKYSGMRGTNYTVTVGSGKNRRTEVRTRWDYTGNTISRFFDDIPVPATHIVPSQYLSRIGGWDLHNLVNMDQNYLSGFFAEKYAITLKEGYKSAQKNIDNHITNDIYQDIGGDCQQILTRSTIYRNVTFKLVLAPVYICSYTYNAKSYLYIVNGRSGRSTGDYPKSAIKIIFTVLLGILALFLLYWLLSGT